MMRRLHANRSDSFDDRYQLLENNIGDSVKMEVFSNCHKDLSSTEHTEFDKWQHRRVVETAKWEICTCCNSRKPQSLQKLCCVEVLSKEYLTRDAVQGLHPIIIQSLMDVAVNCLIRPKLESTYASIRILLEHWPFEVIDLQLLKKRLRGNGVVACLVLEQFVADHKSRAQQRPTVSKLKELVMTIDKRSNYILLYKKLASIADGEEMTPYHSNTEPMPKYVITTDIVVQEQSEFQKLITTFRKLRRTGSPLEMRIAEVHAEYIGFFDITTLFTEINPEFLTSFTSKRYYFQPRHVTQLTKVLSPCVRLHSLILKYEIEDPTFFREDQEAMANAMSLLLRRFPNMKQLTLNNFPIAGYADRYFLPPLLEQLCLSSCDLSYADWDHWANVCNTSSIQNLVIYKCKHSAGDSEGLRKFIEKHAETLTSLWIHIEGEYPTIDSLRRMALHLSHFQILNDFTYHTENSSAMLAVLREVMPWIAINDSLNAFSLSSVFSGVRNNEEFRESVLQSLKAVCTDRNKPLLLAIVKYVRGEGNNNVVPDDGDGNDDDDGGGGNEVEDEAEQGVEGGDGGGGAGAGQDEEEDADYNDDDDDSFDSARYHVECDVDVGFDEVLPSDFDEIEDEGAFLDNYDDDDDNDHNDD